MPYATNPIDQCTISFEDDGGTGPPVVFLPGLGAPAAAARASALAQAFSDGYRRVFVDHRGSGRSDKPHDQEAYRTSVRVADVTAVLDTLSIDRAHVVGASWGARLGYGIGEHAAERVCSLTLGGQQPYAMDPDGPMVQEVTRALAAAHRDGMEPFVQFMEGLRALTDAQRGALLDNDGQALHAAWSAALAEGAVVTDLTTWRIPCLIYAGTEDADFFAQARHASAEIPDATFVPLEGCNHLEAHFHDDEVVPHAKRLIDRTAC